MRKGKPSNSRANSDGHLTFFTNVTGTVREEKNREKRRREDEREKEEEEEEEKMRKIR